MKFFVDTADTSEIKALAASGLLDGVTTNPSLIAKSGRRILDVVAEICALVEGPVSAEVAVEIAGSATKPAWHFWQVPQESPSQAEKPAVPDEMQALESASQVLEATSR